MILPNCESTAVKKLQADDVSLAYEFSKKVYVLATVYPFDVDTFEVNGLLTHLVLLLAVSWVHSG